MRRTLPLLVAVVLLGWSGSLVRGEEIRTIEEWQIKGIHAALEDGYPEVRGLAVNRLRWLLSSDFRDVPPINRPIDKPPTIVWKGRSREETKRLVPKLVILLGDKNPDAALALGHVAEAKLLGETEAKSALPGLRRMLAEDSPSVSYPALDALGRMAEAGLLGAADAEWILPELARLSLRGQWYSPVPDAVTRMAKGKVIDSTGSRWLFTQLRPALKHDNLSVRASASQTIGRLADAGLLDPKDAKAILSELRDLLLNEQDYVRDAAAVTVGQFVKAGLLQSREARQLFPTLVGVLRDKNKRSRRPATDLITDMKKAGVIDEKEAASLFADLRTGLRDKTADVRADAAKALGRMAELGLLDRKQAATITPELLEMVKERVRPNASETPYLPQSWWESPAEAAAEALGQLARAGLLDKKDAAPIFRDLSSLLEGDDPYAREATVLAVVRMAGVELLSTADLRSLLESKWLLARVTGAEAVARMVEVRSGRGADRQLLAPLRKLLEDRDRIACSAAAKALGRMAEAGVLNKTEAQEIFPRLRDAISPPKEGEPRFAPARGAPPLREDNVSVYDHLSRGPIIDAVARLVSAGLIDASSARLLLPPLSRSIGEVDWMEAKAASQAAAQLVMVISKNDDDVKAIMPELLDCLRAEESAGLSRVRETLEKLRAFVSILRFIELTYDDTAMLHVARWLALYFGGGEPAAKTLTAYLGRPATIPTSLPNDRKAARDVLLVLQVAWKGSDSPWLKEDVATWVGLIVGEADQKGQWREEDVPLLEGYAADFRKDEQTRARAYVPLIERALEPFAINPSPLVRTVIAAGLATFFGLLFLFLMRGKTEARWLPSIAFFATGLIGIAGHYVTQQVLSNANKLHLIPWLLVTILLLELVLLAVFGAISETVLRQLAKIKPFHYAIPLALRLGSLRKRCFTELVREVDQQLQRDKRQAMDESYVCLPAVRRSHDAPAQTVIDDPAAEILRRLSSEDGCHHVLIEATGGRGKSALVREIVRRALVAFEANPATAPLPILLTGKGDSLEKMVEAALKQHLLADEFLTMHLEAGDFFLVLDGASETGLSAETLSEFLNGPHGKTTPVLLAVWPNKAFRDAIEGRPRWLALEPCRLSDQVVPLATTATLDDFVTHYKGSLSDPLRDACRDSHGTYLPILVRMAMDTPAAAGLTDVYHRYFLKTFEAQFPVEGERLKKLAEAATWCLRTYWRDGVRKRAYEAELAPLKAAGLLIPSDTHDPPREVQFFHDSMQSYLTACGLWLQDEVGYKELPQPKDVHGNDPWTRERILLRAAGHPTFLQARADLLPTGGTELFQMLLAIATDDRRLHDTLHKELLRWLETHQEHLDDTIERQEIKNAIPPDVLEEVKRTPGNTRLLEAAIKKCYLPNQPRETVIRLGRLYALLAPHVLDLEEHPPLPAAA